MGSKESAKERREKRLQEISLLRTIPYSDHQRFGFSHFIHQSLFNPSGCFCFWILSNFLYKLQSFSAIRKPTNIFFVILFALHLPHPCASKASPFGCIYRWWSSETIAVVTGGNRGIGFEISRQLAVHGLTVILTSRDSNVGLEATRVLQEGALNVLFHQLDVLDPSSIKQFSEWLQQNYGGLDILVSFQCHICCCVTDMFRL
jgi:hypothetical protein